MTLGDARKLLRTLVEKGHQCPCCKQFAKVYKRPINSKMAQALIRLKHLRLQHEQEYFHVDTFARGSHEAAQLQWWGLIEESKEPRADGCKAGWWRMTMDGVAFVNRSIKQPKYARVYDGRLLGFVGEEVDIVACLGKKFDYNELMSR
jgi:hypothetical protein